jgi:hypothetical protein
MQRWDEGRARMTARAVCSPCSAPLRTRVLVLAAWLTKLNCACTNSLKQGNVFQATRLSPWKPAVTVIKRGGFDAKFHRRSRRFVHGQGLCWRRPQVEHTTHRIHTTNCHAALDQPRSPKLRVPADAAASRRLWPRCDFAQRCTAMRLWQGHHEQAAARRH